MVDISLSQLGIDTLDMLTLEIPPFITESQLAMALYHIKVVSKNRDYFVDRNIKWTHIVFHNGRHISVYCRGKSACEKKDRFLRSERIFV